VPSTCARVAELGREARTKDNRSVEQLQERERYLEARIEVFQARIRILQTVVDDLVSEKRELQQQLWHCRSTLMEELNAKQTEPTKTDTPTRAKEMIRPSCAPSRSHF
jgi:predicted RNase H-like nuclease (RuvC/YqgF family)